MYVIYRFVYIYKFIFYRFTNYLYKITYIFEKFGNLWVAILRRRQYLSCNSSKIRQFLSFNSSKSREFFFILPPVWRHSIFLEYLWCREYGGIRSLRVNIQKLEKLENFPILALEISKIYIYIYI